MKKCQKEFCDFPFSAHARIDIACAICKDRPNFKICKKCYKKFPSYHYGNLCKNCSSKRL